MLLSKRYRDSIKNTKVTASVDCGSDHHLVLAKIEKRLKKTRTSKSMLKWKMKRRGALVAKQKREV